MLTDEWQPIETAPRDGTGILLFLADAQMAVGEFKTFRDGSAAWEIGHAEGGVSFQLSMAATHWMPLPPPPMEQTDATENR